MERALHFIEHIIEEDLGQGYTQNQLRFRFPPEPNGYLHIGHVKAICLNFNLGERYQAPVNLRFDDTNPAKEEQQFVEAIKENIQWLGYQWDNECYASDYFEQLFLWAEQLIADGKAYVDSQSSEEIANQKGTPTQAGSNSPYRDRPVTENQSLFAAMKAGKFKEGEHVLRAKIDMSSPNMLMRDPVMYRILYKSHHRTGDKWCIYPMYDFAHALSDAYEGITYSLCTLEFEDHRPLYNWFIEQVETEHRPRQIEFSRLNMAYALTSKRKLHALIENRVVDGWDDPRLVTISGMRRRGYPPKAILDFCERIGITKKDNYIEMGVLENSVREELGDTTQRRMGVLDPLKVTIQNFENDKVEVLEAQNHPQIPEFGMRKISFTKELYIEKGDFKEDAPRKFHRLKPGGEVRLRYAYIIKCEEVVKDSSGNIKELICSYDPDTKSGTGKSDKKVKGTIHWVSAKHSFDAEIRLYDRLFKVHNPAASDDLERTINPDSLKTVQAKLEDSLGVEDAPPSFQLERTGYFCLDTKLSNEKKRIYNRIVTLRDSWAKIEKAAMSQG